MKTITCDIQIDTPIERVFEFLADPNHLPEFWPNFIEVKNVKKSKVSDGFTFNWDYKMSGVRFEGKAETVEYVPYERLVIRSDKGLESTITWRFQLSGRGTHLMLKFDYQIPPALLKRTKEEIVLRENEHEVDAMLQNVKSILELQPAYA